MTDHTPGPWNLTDDLEITSRHNARGHKGVIAEIHRYATAAETTQNGRLIAAAPELLAVVEELLKYGQPHIDLDDEMLDALDHATAVVATARNG